MEVVLLRQQGAVGEVVVVEHLLHRLEEVAVVGEEEGEELRLPQLEALQAAAAARQVLH